MSILIKDMDMPSECEYCPLCRYYPENKRVWCNGTNRILKKVWENPNRTHLGVKKPAWCPLVEIPKGVRLIDANKISSDMDDMKVEGEVFVTAVNYVKLIVNDAPTIFEEDDE